MSRKFSFWTVFYSIFVLMLSTNIPSPLYSLYKEKYQFSPFVLTLIFATYAIVLIPSLAVFGKAADRYGRKKLIWAGAVFSMLGSVLFAVSTSVFMLFFARAFQGLAVGMISGAASAALVELNPYKSKHTAALAASIATAAGTALGPLISGAIAQYIVYPEISPYITHLLLAVPSLIGILWVNETVSTNKSEQPKPFKNQESIPDAIKKPFRYGALTAFLAWSVTALFMSVIPSYISALLNIHNLAFSGGVVFLMLGSSVVVQLLFRKLGYMSSMIAGLITIAFGVATVAMAFPYESVSTLLVGTVAAGVGQGLAFKGSMQLVNLIAPANQKGKMISAFYIYIYAGVSLPIIGVGILSAKFGMFHAILYFASVICFLSILVIVRLCSRSVRLQVGM